MRLDAIVSADKPDTWVTDSGIDVTGDVEDFPPEQCNVGSDAGQAEKMTLGFNLATKTFSCLSPEDLISALLGGQSTPPTTPQPEGSCPEDGGEWEYVDEEHCVQ